MDSASRQVVVERASTPSLPNDATLLRAIVETAGSVIIGLRADHTIVMWNRAAEMLYQTPREQALGLDFLEHFIVPEHRALVAADIQDVLRGKHTVNFEDDSLLPDGRRRTLLWNVTRLPTDAGQESAGILAIGHDITERKAAEQRFQLIFSESRDGLVLSDERGVVLDCNPAAVAMLGLTTSDELIGRKASEFSPPYQPDGSESRARSEVIGRETRARGEATFEWVHRRADGVDVLFEVSVAHVQIGGQQHSVVRWHDLSRRQQLEADRAALQQRLFHSQKLEAVGQLAGGVAHDFNNLLAGTHNLLELVVPRVADRPDVQQDVRLALEITGRAADLTTQLLVASRQQVIVGGPVDWNESIRRSLGLLQSMTPPEVAWSVSLADTAVTVIADPSQLDQILMNLTINARDAMLRGGRLTVALEPDAAARTATLTVTDDGVGMDRTTRDRMFEAYFSTKPPGRGSGLGLSVVYGIVGQWQGSIDVDSVPGRGTTVRVTLPYAPSAVPPVVSPTPVSTVAVNIRVLLVDDDAAVRTTTRRILERAEFHVDEAEDGEVAWSRLQHNPNGYHVVLSDMRMPRLDGIRLVERMRAAHDTTPIVLMSGFGQIEYPHGHTVSAIEIVRKPFRSGDLVATLRRAARATLGEG